MAVTRTKIVSLAEAKRFLRIATTDTTTDRLLDELIDAATTMIEKELGTSILQTTISKEYHSGDGHYFLYLDNYPVSSVNRVAVGRTTGLTATYTGSGTHASIEVQSSQVRLRTTVSGVLTTSDIVFSDNATLSDMDTAIDAVTGWSASAVSTFSSYPSSDLLTVPAKNAKTITVNLDVPDTPEDDYELFPHEGYLYKSNGVWYGGANNIVVDYVCGWLYENVPTPLRSACLDIVKLLFDVSSKDAALKKESIGDYSYELGDVSSMLALDKNPLIQTKLGPFRRKLLM